MLACALDFLKNNPALLPSSVTAVIALLAYFRYYRDLNWRRSEFLAKQILEFECDQAVGLVQSILEYQNRPIYIACKDDQAGSIAFKTNSASVIRALRLDTDELTIQEFSLRDVFDRFLWYLGHFQTMATADPKLMTYEDLHPYLMFWLGKLKRSDCSKEDLTVPDAVWKYAERYWCNTAYKLLLHYELADRGSTWKGRLRIWKGRLRIWKRRLRIWKR
jgi:hypothetical protein